MERDEPTVQVSSSARVNGGKNFRAWGQPRYADRRQLEKVNLAARAHN